MEKDFFTINEIDIPQIKYGFFTRKIYDSKIKNNIFQISKAINLLNLKNKKIKLVNQIHSNLIAEINNDNFDIEIEADGLITNNFSIGLGILTADCAPIFIFDKKKSFICCLHAGWRGTLSKIVEKALNIILKKYTKNLNDIIVIIGPCLNQNNFEVDNKFKNSFIKLNQKYENFFKKKNDKKDLFDMRKVINFQFKNMNLKNIFNLNEDTYQNEGLFFSYRRSLHRNLSEKRRMINIISFE